MFGFKKRRRDRLRARPFPPAWLGFLEKNVAYYHCLPTEEQRELQGHLQVFLAEKNFEGCGGLVLTDEIKVTIAAYACVLLLHRRHDYYPLLQSVLVYPEAYTAPVERPGPGPFVTEGDEVRFGESWHSGAVVVSWNPLHRRPSDPNQGHNVVLHEFAHQVDQENGFADGAPPLAKSSQYAAWARILGREYDRLARDTAAGRPTVLDAYGATDPAEFFAVATECFFEKPRELRDQHPELYDELKLFYRQDPAGRI